ncbi:hypothetical protein D4Z93_04560 [Clostridium fermenticellae]|uniref:Uncharacterized protein n=1 Tax=Clostridium fermenticellae TaxID=2068654 RepID=A0A386H2E0_9CLOT|nr:hypothetical protein [Clostridium fermenticellae]AYD39826.1 hypothetical protein D4Z93_04560 [Clostridium fermenticellae]
MLKEKIFSMINELCDSTQKIIFQKHKITSEFLEMYIVITKLPSVNIPRFRVYKGLQYESSISVEYFTIEEDMFEAMVGKVEYND